MKHESQRFFKDLFQKADNADTFYRNLDGSVVMLIEFFPDGSSKWLDPLDPVPDYLHSMRPDSFRTVFYERNGSLGRVGSVIDLYSISVP